VAVPEQDVSQFLFGLYRDAGAIRVRRAETVTLGRVQEAHMRRVIEAWMAAARREPGPAVQLAAVRSVPISSAGPGGRLRAALGRRLGR
jgi:hypothetical protein